MTPIWAQTGTRPRVVQQQQFKYAYMFGAMCNAAGETETIIVHIVNKDIMKQHLKQISDKTRSDRYAVVMMGRSR
ncbi:MAG: hypothetical protein ACI8XG_000174 [Congregibacter sp.]|jgi:hypothetical protein